MEKLKTFNIILSRHLLTDRLLAEVCKICSPQGESDTRWRTSLPANSAIQPRQAIWCPIHLAMNGEKFSQLGVELRPSMKVKELKIFQNKMVQFECPKH